MSYKVEELLALRDSVSESAVSLDKFADEEVIKEHVLRPTASATLAATASNKSLRLSATPAIAPASLDKKPSPSPSIKRGKAERLLKEHGSPPGMRVTAGGRVVPSDLQPLINNRFVNNAFKPPPLRDLTSGSTMTSQPPRSGTSDVPRLEVVGSQPMLYVGNRVYALPALDTSTSTLPSANPGLVDASAKPAPPPSVSSAQNSFNNNNAQLAPPRANSQTPFSGLDLSTLKTQQTLKRQELRTVEQTEVLQASHQTDAWRASIIEKKRNLIIELDALRKQISALEAANNNVPPAQPNGFAAPAASSVTGAPPPAFVPQFPQSLSPAVYGYPGSTPFSPMLLYQPPFGTFPAVPTTEPPAFVPTPIQPPHSPGSASRRSHAIEIKPPRNETSKQVTSVLDPKSPTYEPMPKGTSAQDGAPPTPSPAKRPDWRANEAIRSESNEERALSHKPSLSSIDTTDFFPTNTHEHSTTRMAPNGLGSKQACNEVHKVPSTPEKNWPASPWNDGNSSRSSRKAVANLPSWPEAFGKHPSVPSLKQMVSPQEHAPFAATEPSRSAPSNDPTARKTSEQRSGTDENWSMLRSKPTIHVPSTYQEGYQAGYDHIGVPDSPEVLKGYIQGLLQFMADESQRERGSSLRGLVASSTPHDSAICMSFSRPDGLVGSQENVRLHQSNTTLNVRKESEYGPQDAPRAYSPYSDAAQDQRLRNSSLATYLIPTVNSDTSALAYRHMMSAPEHEVVKRTQDKGSMSHPELDMPIKFAKQFTGSQTNSRSYGNTASVQRFCISPKENESRNPGAGAPLSVRPMANHRLSGLDGAMDDLADVNLDAHIDEQQRAAGGSRSTDASCFRPGSSKGKQKLTTSPKKSTSVDRGDTGVSSPTTTPGSPKKAGEHSPAKAKLEHVTNKFRRSKKEEGRNLSPEERRERSQKWRKRFQALKDRELGEIRSYTNNNSRD